MGNRAQGRWQRGFTLVESTLVLGIMGILGVAGVGVMDTRSARLSALQNELQGSVHQAFVLARARGTEVRVALGLNHSQDPALLPVPLPQGVQWGRPGHIPLPHGMEDAPVASARGAAHVQITVTPRHTVTAGAWFFHDGRNALCLRLSGKGRLTTLRYRASTRQWRVEL